MDIKDLITLIKAKKELKGLPDSLVRETLATYLKKHNLKQPQTSKEAKVIVKAVRAELRNYVGRFRASTAKRARLTESNDIQKLLTTHSSTKERAEHYTVLFNLLERLKPASILDLACGLNPIAVAAMFPKATYHAVDINNEDLVAVKEFFKNNDIEGSVKQADIRSMKSFPEVDVVFLMKVLDIIEKRDHSIAERIVTSLKAKTIIVSFATRTLSGKPMRIPRRGWFEKILRDNNLSYKVRQIPNEIFYIVTSSF